MAVEWNLVCRSHTPHLHASENEQGTPSIYELQWALIYRDEIAAIPPWVWGQFAYELPRHIRWIRTHQDCDVIIKGDNREEYWPDDLGQVRPANLHAWFARKVAR